MKVLANGCRVVASHESEWQSEGTRQYRTPINRASGARDIAQTISHYERGRAPLRCNATSEEVLYVFAGSGVCRIEGMTYNIRQGSAIYMPPQAQYQIENPNDDLLKIVSVCCSPQSDSNGVEAAESGASAGGSKPNPACNLVIHESDRAAIATGDRSFHLLVHKDLGCEHVTQFLGLIPPSRAPRHFHTYEEAIYILQGSGIVWADDESCEFSVGTSIYLPPGQRHCLENPGPEEVRLIGVFYPSGSPAVNYKD